MKIKLTYIVPLLVAALISGCAKTNDQQNVPLPTGNFTGQFLHIRRNPTTSKLDTIKANLQISLSQTTGFKITGDTATVHAGSFGSYGVNAYNIQFVDQTYLPNKPFTKYHLQGIYDYNYDGTKLTIYANYADTLSFQYLFSRTN